MSVNPGRGERARVWRRAWELMCLYLATCFELKKGIAIEVYEKLLTCYYLYKVGANNPVVNLCQDWWQLGRRVRWDMKIKDK